jgi:hypothetical protein
MTGVVAAQLESLLRIIESHRDTHCREAIESAERRAREIKHSARHEARLRMGEAIRQQRARGHQRIETYRAQVQTRIRRHEHTIALSMLERCRENLGRALQARWQDREARAEWIEALIEQGRATLPRQPWRVEHPEGWDRAELTPWVATVRTHAGAEPEFVSQSGIVAGLRLVVGKARLDGTLDGLVADREAIEAQLMAEIGREIAARSGGGGVLP